MALRLKTEYIEVIEIAHGGGISFVVPFPFVEGGIDLTGRYAAFNIKKDAANRDLLFSASTENGKLTIDNPGTADQAVTVEIDWRDASEHDAAVTLESAIGSLKNFEHGIDFRSAAGGPLDFRIQGDLKWIDDTGGPRTADSFP